MTAVHVLNEMSNIGTRENIVLASLTSCYSKLCDSVRKLKLIAAFVRHIQVNILRCMEEEEKVAVAKEGEDDEEDDDGKVDDKEEDKEE